MFWSNGKVRPSLEPRITEAKPRCCDSGTVTPEWFGARRLPVLHGRGNLLSDKTADLAGPGISTYEEVVKILTDGYTPLLSCMDTQRAVFVVKGETRTGSAGA